MNRQGNPFGGGPREACRTCMGSGDKDNGHHPVFTSTISPIMRKKYEEFKKKVISPSRRYQGARSPMYQVKS